MQGLQADAHDDTACTLPAATQPYTLCPLCINSAAGSAMLCRGEHDAAYLQGHSIIPICTCSTQVDALLLASGAASPGMMCSTARSSDGSA